MTPANMYADILRNDLYPFIHRSFLELNPGETFHCGWHLEFLAEWLEDVRFGLCKRLIVCMPPRMLKSHAISVAFPAWLLGHDPTKKIIVLTYAQDLSDDFARKCLRLMKSPFYQALFDTRLATGREAVAEFHTTAGGYRFSTSMGGVVTGWGADIIIVDDPTKADEAQSDTRRRAANQTYDDTVRSRLNNQETGAKILTMQRLHADDMVAHVQQHEHWDLVSFSAIAEEHQTYDFHTSYGRRLIHRKVGDLLQPARLSVSTLESLRRTMTDYNFAAQYQQNPQPPSGNIVKRKWLKFYSPDEAPKQFDQIIQSWDTANKNTELANYSVCTTWGRKGQKLYLLDVFRRKLDFPELKRAVKDHAILHQATVVLIEDKASGTSLIPELRAENFMIAQAAPNLDGDKIMRLHSQTAKIEGGFVLFPKEAPWLADYLNELTAFPNSKHDDQVDSTVFALAWLSLNPSVGGTAESLEAYNEFLAALPFRLKFGV